VRVLGIVASLVALIAACCYGLANDVDAWSGQAVIEGDWEGAIDVSGVSIGIRVVFAPAPEGLSAAIDIPQQGASGLPLQNVSFDGSRIHFELPTTVLAVFEGTLSSGSMSGTFTQGAASGRFLLTRVADVPAEPPPPYGVEEVRVTSEDVTLAGTLTIPEGRGPFPAVVLLTGSGAQTRDEEVAGFKIFGVLADHLTRRGIAVLRYDDRGVGGSTGSVALSTTEDFSHDALAAMAFLRSRSDIDAAHVGLIGHSEGGAVAALAATAPDGRPAFIVMLAGTAVPGTEITRQQVTDAARLIGATDEQLAQILAAHTRVTELVGSGAPGEAVVDAVRALMRAQLEGRPPAAVAAIGDLDAFIDARIDVAVAGIVSPWSRFFMTFDPASALTRVQCPVLAILGGRDTQVPPWLHRPALERALSGNARATIHEYPTANHLFQEATTGQVTEYPRLDKAFVPGLLDDLSGWILEATAGP